jgi:D-alanyl-D-alanine carboxypeptidase (penicillin-binding protein 5/6)
MNRNRLLWSDPTVDGVKNRLHRKRRLLPGELGAPRGAAGHLDRARRRLRLGAGGREPETADHGFQSYEGVRLYSASQPVTTIRVWKGTANR